MVREPEPLWDVAELCGQLRVARSTVYDWVHMGFIPHIRMGGCVRFRPSDIAVWIDQQASPGRARRVPAVEV
jgi:excisionase family DNA binding protein